MADDGKKVSFGFSKKSNQKLNQDSKYRDETTKVKREEKDLVLSLKHRHIESSVPEVEKSTLVVPLIAKNNWRLPSTVAGSNVKLVDCKSELETQAVKEILEVAKKLSEGANGKDTPDSDLMIPMLMQNKIPDGYETENKVDVILRPVESSMEDYDQVPVEEFGLAVLRGMGWKPTTGIGSKYKRDVAPIEPKFRPKGLGLGADPKVKSKTPSAKEPEKEEKKEMKVGAYVRVVLGAHKDRYGQVEGLDNARVTIKLSVNSKTVSVEESAVEVVSKHEYKRDGKLINKSKYEEYRAKSEADMEAQRNRLDPESGRLEESRHSSHDEKRRHHQHHSHRTKHVGHQDKPSKHERDDSPPEKKHKSPPPWVRQQLRVRFIERAYKGGRYFNTKVTIEDVTQKNVCLCRTDSGQVLEDIPARWLETIVPKASPPYVMIVQGNHRGRLAEIMERDPDKCLATLQLLQEKEVVKLDYDSICEYSGTDY